MPPLLALLVGVAPTPTIVVAGERRPFAVAPLSARELAVLRGGLRLPNGLDVSLGIDLQTRIDGLLALHTVYASEGSQPGIRVYTDGAKPVPLAPATQTIEGQAVMGTPVLIVDRSPTGTTIVPTSATAATTVNLVNGDPATWLSGEGQTPVAVTANGAPVATSEGAVTLTSDPTGSVVTLTGSQFEIRQLIGQATGVVVANAANDRTISTTSSVNVDLQGFTPALVASAFAAARLAEESIAGR